MNRQRVEFGWRTVAVAGAASALFLALLWLGYRQGVAPSIGWASPRDGALLGYALVRTIELVPWPWPTETVSAVIAIVCMGWLMAWLYERLIYNDWRPIKALLLTALIAANPMIIATAAYDHRALSTMLACIALIPGIRRIESVGDTQANMSFGLILPLLFLDGPALAPLILPLALFGALSDDFARKHLSAFGAMFLVAIMPTLLVLVGLAGAFDWSGLVDILRVYLQAWGPAAADPAEAEAFRAALVWIVAPFGLITLFYMFDRDRRWQPVSALVAFALPFYLAFGAMSHRWDIPPTLPVVAFLGAFASWLSVARLKPAFRSAAVALMAMTTLMAWTMFPPPGVPPLVPASLLPSSLTGNLALPLR